jgi:hypothetical protein
MKKSAKQWSEDWPMPASGDQGDPAFQQKSQISKNFK